MVRVCAIIGGIYAVSSIFESLLRNSISIFSFGAPDENAGAAKSTMKRVKKAPVYTNIETNETIVEESEAIEMKTIVEES